jgi:hypothetical protein
MVSCPPVKPGSTDSAVAPKSISRPPAGPHRGGQRRGHLPGIGQIEVAEAVAQADRRVEPTVGGDVAHVGDREVNRQPGVGGRATGMRDGLGRDVHPGHPMTPGGQRQRVPAAAARHIQNARAGCQPELTLDEVDLGLGGFGGDGAAPELIG